MNKMKKKIYSKDQLIAFLGYSPRWETKDCWIWTLLTPIPFGILLITIPLAVTEGDSCYKLNILSKWIYVITVSCAVLGSVILYIIATRRLKEHRRRARIGYERDVYIVLLIWAIPTLLAFVQGTNPELKVGDNIIKVIILSIVFMSISYLVGIQIFMMLIGKSYYSTEFAKKKVHYFGNDEIKRVFAVGIPLILKYTVGNAAMLYSFLVLVLVALPVTVAGYQLKLKLAKELNMEEYLIGFGSYYDHE